MSDPLPDPVPPLTEAETTEANEEYDKTLKPAAVAKAREYVLAHTPPRLQKLMLGKVDGDFPEPPPPAPAAPAAPAA